MRGVPAFSRTARPGIDPSAQDRSARLAVTVFPVLVLLGAIIGFVANEPVRTLAPGINPLLGLIMFGMGMTLTPADFATVARRPLPVGLGILAQFAIMPLLGLAIAAALALPPELAAGVILVGCVPGGTASNVITYLAKADTALSVAMTTCSTLLAPLLTPLLAWWLAGAYLPVDGPAMGRSIVQIVLVPVVAGLLARVAFARLVGRVMPVLPWVSVLTISLVVAIVVAGSADRVASAGLLVFVAVVLHNGCGYALGYGLAALARQPERVRRTVAIEVGMQNSGLAAGLAAAAFSPAAALPGAMFSIWHNVSGSLLASVFRWRDARVARASAQPTAAGPTRPGP